MLLFPASFLILAIWALVVLRSQSGPYLMVLAMLPFGMFAVVQIPSLSGLSITATLLFASMAAGLATFRGLLRLGHGDIRLNPAAIALAVFTIYAIFSALILARFFEGAFLVYPITRGATGIQVSPHFPSVMAPMARSSANLSQTFYIIIAFAFFVAFCSWLRRTGPVAGERLFALAAGLNIVLGVLNLVEADFILSWFQTATYTLHDQQSMGGLRRAIGGFSEPSSFGAATAAFFAYFASAWAYSYRPRDFFLAFANGCFVILSYSSTGFAALAVVCCIFALKLLLGIQMKRERRVTIFAIIGFFAALAVLAAILASTQVLYLLIDLMDQLFLSKLDSLSGQERSSWSESGLNAFYSTWGLGAGAGSLRSNGLLPVLLGSVGLPGTLAFFAFLWFAIGRSSRGISDPQMRRVYASGQVAAVAQLTAMALSVTVPDPTLLLIICCAMAAVARENSANAAPASWPLSPSRFDTGTDIQGR